MIGIFFELASSRELICTVGHLDACNECPENKAFFCRLMMLLIRVSVSRGRIEVGTCLANGMIQVNSLKSLGKEIEMFQIRG